MQGSQKKIGDALNRKIILSGIQPTGVVHLGNYLGALRQWKKFELTSDMSTKLIFIIADLHALNIRHESGVLKERRRRTLASILATGLNAQRCMIFYQSAVS